MFIENLIAVWKSKELKNFVAKKRRYLHFDPRINFLKNQDQLASYLQNEKKIASHAFYPFIKASLITPRYKKVVTQSGAESTKRKIENKERPIMYAGHFDSFIYSWYSTILTNHYECKIHEEGIFECVLAYLEKSKSNIDFAYEAFTEVKERGKCATIAVDVKGFFDNLDHEYLKKMWCKMLNIQSKLPPDHYNVYTSITKFNFVELEALRATLPTVFDQLESNSKKRKVKSRIPIDRLCSPKEFRDKIRKQKLIRKNEFRNNITGNSRCGEICGIPQGSPISATLSNIYMFDFDIVMKRYCDSIGARYMRYCDDILVITGVDNIDQMQNHISKEIENIFLKINDVKTEITVFKIEKKGHLFSSDCNGKPRNMQYLGFEFDGNNAFIRSSSFSKYHGRMSARIRENLKAAYGNQQIGDAVFKKKLYNRYTQKGSRNFITYAVRAAETMKSETIAKQYKNSMSKVKKKLTKKKAQIEEKRQILDFKR